MSENIWRNAPGEACIEFKINGRSKKVSKGGIANLKAQIGTEAQTAGINKFSVKIDGEEVSPDDIGDYSVDDIRVVSIDTYDVVRA